MVSRVVGIVDPISTGACLARYLADKGYALVRIWSDQCPADVRNLVKSGLEVDWIDTVEHKGDAAETEAALRRLGMTDVLVGSEPGVNLHADLTASFGKSTAVDADKLAARRNKYLQSECVRNAGLSAARQTLANSMADVEHFIADMEETCAAASIPFKAVVKPVEGAGSDGVSICNSAEEARAAFERLQGTKNILGLENYSALCQEFLAGDEYVVDSVSLAGEHKIVAIWKYDKRDYHGKPVVYHGMELLNVESNPELHAPLVAYITGVLEALHIRDGAMHSEVMATRRGPVLVEVNCRLHGGEGIWLPISEACLGYSQVTALHDAAFHAIGFNALPTTPLHPMMAHGAWVTLRSPQSGVIAAINEASISTIRALASFESEYLAPLVAVGETIVQTIDATTVHGCFNLVHADKATLDADYALAQKLINESIFTFEGAATASSAPPAPTPAAGAAHDDGKVSVSIKLTKPTSAIFEQYTPAAPAVGSRTASGNWMPLSREMRLSNEAPLSRGSSGHFEEDKVNRDEVASKAELEVFGFGFNFKKSPVLGPASRTPSRSPSIGTHGEAFALE